MYARFKRFLDFISALVLFFAISPLFLLIWILVRLNLGKPVFFTQERSGLHRKVFRIIKFRSMTNTRDENGKLLPDEQRTTMFGSWLRKTSLDELPELLSIIKGDMAVIGPRPLPPLYDDYYTEREKKRFEVRGGLIPPEVLYGNILPTWNEQLEYEANYAENISFRLDLQVMKAVFNGLFTRYEKNQGGVVRESLVAERSRKI